MNKSERSKSVRPMGRQASEHGGEVDDQLGKGCTAVLNSASTVLLHSVATGSRQKGDKLPGKVRTRVEEARQDGDVQHLPGRRRRRVCPILVAPAVPRWYRTRKARGGERERVRGKEEKERKTPPHARLAPFPLACSLGQARCGCSRTYNNMIYKFAALEAASLSRRRSASC